MPISLVGSWVTNNTTVGQVSLSVTKLGCTLGNTLVVVISYGGLNNYSLKDQTGTVYFGSVQQDSGGSGGVAIYFVQVSRGIGADITITVFRGKGSASSFSIALAEFSGVAVDQPSPVDKTAAHENLTSTSFTSGAGVTPANGGCLKIGCTTHFGTDTTTAGNGTQVTVTETFLTTSQQPLTLSWEVLSGFPTSQQTSFSTLAAQNGETALLLLFPEQSGISLGVSADINHQSKLQAIGAASLGVTTGLAESSIGQMSSALSLPIATGISDTALELIRSSLSLGVTPGATFNAVNILMATVSLQAALAFLESEKQTIPGAVSLGVTSGFADIGIDPPANVNFIATLGAYATSSLVTTPAPVATIDQYLSLITSEHNQRPKFMAMLRVILEPFVSLQVLLSSFPQLFDIDKAVGDQLDKLGQWIGISRNITIPLSGVYFTWGTANLGWGQGTWFFPGNQSTGLVTLPDDTYRVLLKAQIAINHWDGTVPNAYNIWNIVFVVEGFQILIQDNQDMSMSIIFITPILNAVVKGLLLNGYLIPRPAGVRIAGYFQATVPVFGFGVQNSTIAGWGTGNWISLATIT